MTGDDWIEVASLEDVADGAICAVTVKNKPIALYKIGEEVFATANICTHAFAYLSDGYLEGDVIECPLHAGRFNIRTGKALGAPVTCDLKTYPVRIASKAIFVQVRDGKEEGCLQAAGAIAPE